MNEDIKKMATLLKTGHTMLNRACPICNNPLFRNPEGITFCPACNREVIIVDEESHHNNDNMRKKGETIQGERQSNTIQQDINLKEINGIIVEKINLISQKLKSENQIDLIDKYSNILMRLFNILKVTKK